MGIKDKWEAWKQKKSNENKWKDDIKKEALLEARIELKEDLKRKYIQEEKDKLSGKSKILTAFQKEFSSVGPKTNQFDMSGGSSGTNFQSALEREFGKKSNTETSNNSNSLNFQRVLDNEFGKKGDVGTTKIGSILKSQDDIIAMAGGKKADKVTGQSNIDRMLGKGINTQSPQDKIGAMNFIGLKKALKKTDKDEKY